MRFYRTAVGTPAPGRKAGAVRLPELAEFDSIFSPL
jgi:hypothetical protein